MSTTNRIRGAQRDRDCDNTATKMGSATSDLGCQLGNLKFLDSEKNDAVTVSALPMRQDI